MLTSGVYLYVLLFLATRAVHVQTSCSCTQPDSKFASGVNLTYYKCTNGIKDTVNFSINDTQGLLNVLSNDKRTIVYIFGYLEAPSDNNVQIMIKALCDGGTDNVVLLDWSKYSKGVYPLVFENAKKVGILFANSTRLLKDKGFDVSKLYIIGHSLGAHIAGFVGKCNEFVIPRITGLDPANPMANGFLGCYLTSTDAAWVDVIHTDAGGYGTFLDSGTAEYYANGGTRPQPGCGLVGLPLSKGDLCSHQRSVEIYAWSKYQPNEFIATMCASSTFYKIGACKGNRQTGVGYGASPVEGSFYFETGEL